MSSFHYNASYKRWKYWSVDIRRDQVWSKRHIFQFQYDTNLGCLTAVTEGTTFSYLVYSVTQQLQYREEHWNECMKMSCTGPRRLILVNLVHCNKLWLVRISGYCRTCKTNQVLGTCEIFHHKRIKNLTCINIVLLTFQASDTFSSEL